MTQPRRTIRDALTHWKPPSIFPSTKPSDVLGFTLKAAAAICIVAWISIVSYVAFSGDSRRFSCSDLGCPALNTTVFRRKFAAEEAPAVADVAEESTNLSHILFGIGGSAKTWEWRRYYCEQWWRPNVTRGYVWLDSTPSANQVWPETSPPYRVSEDTSRFKYTSEDGSRSAVRIARIAKESFELGLDNVRWFVMGDDDTVFFPDNLVSVLAKYDHRQMYYVGSSSESVEQAVVHSYGMAYGGAGIAVSYPLAAELARVLDGCIDRYASFYGSDQKIQACFDEIGVPLTNEPGFHQLDILGNPYGLLAGHPVAPLVSLHHLDYVRPMFPMLDRGGSLKKLLDAYEVDPGRTLQHSFCYDLNRNWTIYVAWGYTVQLYPWILTAKQMETPLQTFLTWRGSLAPFTFNTRPLSADPCGNPLLYFLNRVGRNGTGRSHTTYDRFEKTRGTEKECKRDDYVSADAVQSFSVSAPLMEKDFWEKAPRRQCCTITDNGNGFNRTIQVEIKRCKPGESVTPS